MSYSPVQSKPGRQLPQLSEFVNYISSFSRISTRTNLVSASDNIKSGYQFQFDLAPSSLIDLSTLCLKGSIHVTATGGQALLPPETYSLINRIQVDTTSTQIDSGCSDTAHLYKILMDHSAGSVNSKRSVVHRGARMGITGTAAGPRKLPMIAYNKPIAVADVANSAYLAQGQANAQPFVISDWLGWLGSQDSYYNTDLTGPTRVTVYLNNSDILQSIGNVTAKDYVLNNVYVSVDVLSVDPLYYQATSMLLAQGQVITKRFSSWHSQRGAPAASVEQTMTVGLASQSIDLALFTFVRDPSSYNVGLDKVGAAGTQLDGTPQGDSTIFFDRLGEAAGKYQWFVNNSPNPLWLADCRLDGWQGVLSALGELHDLTTTCVDSIRDLASQFAPQGPLSVWAAGFFCLAMSLNAQSDPSIRPVSGYDSRGSNATIRIQVQANSARVSNTDFGSANTINSVPLMFIKTTPCLKIAANRLHEIVR